MATQFYAGAAEIGLYRSDTGTIATTSRPAAPGLWVVLRPTGREPPFDAATVTANPSEGEAFTESGADLVEAVPMPDAVQEMIESFIAEHHVEQGSPSASAARRSRRAGAAPARRQGRQVSDRKISWSRWARRKREAKASRRRGAGGAAERKTRGAANGEATDERRPSRSLDLAADRIRSCDDRHPRVPAHRRSRPS